MSGQYAGTSRKVDAGLVKAADISTSFVLVTMQLLQVEGVQCLLTIPLVSSKQTTEDGAAAAAASTDQEETTEDAAAASTDQEETTEDGAAAAASTDQEGTESFVRSEDVICGICMENVYDKTNADDRRFGILPNCNHAFCLKCIVTWRKTKDMRQEVIKSCPQCRVKSSFYVPNNCWVEGQAKKTLVAAFKEKCSKRRCSYYGRYGFCPFKSDCIYRHNATDRRLLRSNYPEDAEDMDGLHLFDVLMAMTVLGVLDEDDDGDDDDLAFFLFV
ncbi:makorin, ring finger protein, 4 [Diretmus argenteus]